MEGITWITVAYVQGAPPDWGIAEWGVVGVFVLVLLRILWELWQHYKKSENAETAAMQSNIETLERTIKQMREDRIDTLRSMREHRDALVAEVQAQSQELRKLHAFIRTDYQDQVQELKNMADVFRMIQKEING